MSFKTIIAALFLIPNPKVQRFFWGLIRNVSPVFILGNRAFVSRYEDVSEVFKRDEDFTTSEIYAKRMADVHLSFMLGMDNSEQHQRESALMQKVVKREDLALIQSFVRKKAEELINKVSTKGQIDVVNEYARVVAVQLVEEYFGIPLEDEEKVKHWMRILFHHIFLNQLENAEIKEKALVAADELKSYVEKVISERKETLAYTGDLKDNILNRLLLIQQSEKWITDDVIRRNICGFLVGAVDTTCKSTVLTMEVLLNKPAELKKAKEMAAKNAIPVLGKYMQEALRFHPHNAVVARYCKKETVLGRKRSKIPANSVVYVGTMSAMFDKAVFKNPYKIDLNREAEYFHYSSGLHACSGKYINLVQIPELMAGLLRLKGLKKGESKVQYEGPFPDKFVLNFEPFTPGKTEASYTKQEATSLVS